MVEVRYVPDGSSRPADEAGLQEYFRSVHPSLSVRTVAVNEIARTPSGEFEDYVSLATHFTRQGLRLQLSLE